LVGVAATADAQIDASDFPGMRLTSRLEAHMARAGDGLRERNLEHWALIGTVDARDLRRWLAPISPRRDGDAWVLAAGGVPELHGGAVLEFLFLHWRPDGRSARETDRYPFALAQPSLGEIEAGHRTQVFLPTADRPQLPRMRFFTATSRAAPVERDAWCFLRLLVAQSDDYDATFSNHVDQTLTVDLLMRETWNHYMRAAGGAAAEEADHSNLHLVEVLLAWSRRTGSRPTPDPRMIQRRFLTHELARPVEETPEENLAHYAESLGHLVADDRLAWGAEQSAAVRAWLAALEAKRFRDLDAEDPKHLAHLLAGLRDVRRHLAHLRAP